MTWTTPRQWIGSNGSGPGWGRDWRTAYAFDLGLGGSRPPRLWVAGRGAGSGPWSAKANGGSFSIVDLGIAINPDDGSGWMGWSAEASYSYLDSWHLW